MDDLTNPNLSPEELKKLMEEREQANAQLEQAQDRAKQADIDKRLKASEAEWETNKVAREARKAKEAAEKAKLLPMDDWKKQYGSKYAGDVAEDMSGDSRSMKHIDDVIKQSKQVTKIDALKNLAKGIGSKAGNVLSSGAKLGTGLAKGLGSGVAQGMLWSAALDPSEIANSELPHDEEGIKQLQAEMQAKNEQYNRPTRFGALRKMMGK